MEFEKYTERARGFVQAAQTAALRAGHQQLTPLHILEVLLADEDGMAARQMALVLVRETVKEKIGDDQAQHPVTEEFLAFAGILDIIFGGGGARMDQRVAQ